MINAGAHCTPTQYSKTNTHVLKAAFAVFFYTPIQKGGYLMLDFTPLLEAVIALAFTLITAFLIPWLKTKYGAETLGKIKSFVEVAVYAAEKAYGAGNGAQKLAYVEKFLAEKKIRLDFNTLKVLVDAEIKKMEQAEHPVIVGELIDEGDETEDEPTDETLHPPDEVMVMD